MNPTWTSRRPVRGELVLGPHHGQGALGIHRQRLLTKDGDPSFDAGERLLLVELPGGGDDDGVDPVVGDRGRRVADHPAAGHADGDLLGLLGEGVAHRGHPRAGDPAVQARHVVGAHHPDAEHGDTQFARRDLGRDRQDAGPCLGGGHACCSWVIFGRSISSEGMPQLPM
jgi:hypothetical protein